MDNVIVYNVVNSLLAGALVFVGAFTDGVITGKEFIAVSGASAIVCLNKFREFWRTEKPVKKRKTIKQLKGVFNFV